MQQLMDRLRHWFLQLKVRVYQNFINYTVMNNVCRVMNKPGIDGLGPKPSNKSIIEELPTGEEACAEGEGEANLASKSIELLLS